MVKLQNNVFIDPDNCGSSIGYYLHIDEYTPKDRPVTYSINATVVLADCSHKIDWSFSPSNGGIEKIDSAIQMLQEFRQKYVETEELAEKLNKRRRVAMRR